MVILFDEYRQERLCKRLDSVSDSVSLAIETARVYRDLRRGHCKPAARLTGQLIEQGRITAYLMGRE